MSAEPLNQRTNPRIPPGDRDIHVSRDGATCSQGWLHNVDLAAPLDDLVLQVISNLATALRVDEVDVFAAVQPDDFKFLGGNGWLHREGADAKELLAYLAPQMTLTLVAREPIAVPDLSRERRFAVSRQLLWRGAHSSLSVVIGTNQREYGVITLLTQRQRDFSIDDIRHVRTVAAVLAGAMSGRSIADGGFFILRRYLSA
jgi:hypothetical protein